MAKEATKKSQLTRLQKDFLEKILEGERLGKALGEEYRKKVEIEKSILDIGGQETSKALAEHPAFSESEAPVWIKSSAELAEEALIKLPK